MIQKLFSPMTFPALPAGQVTELLIGFTNKGEQEMMVDSLEASLRYPMGEINILGLKEL